MNIPSMRASARLAVALPALVLAGAVGAQAAWPSKPVRLVVGFSAGGPTDVVARAFADHAAKALGQPFIVDNKPGANTILAAEAVAGAPADGHTLLLGALERVAQEFVRAPATVDKLRGMGMEPQGVCGAPFAAQLQREVRDYSQLARTLDLKAE